MRTEIFGLFPTPVLKLRFDRPFTQTESDFLLKSEQDVSKPPFVIHLGNSTTESKRLLENPELADIKAYLEKCLDQWVKQIMMPVAPDAFKLKITQSWINYTKPGEKHDRHYHPNSIVSGVLYVNADSNHDMISFAQNKNEQFFIQSRQFNQFNSPEINITVGQYDIILFPSMIGHHVPTTTGNHTRISLAFNTFFEGQIGHLNDLPNYLEINAVR